MSTAGFWQSLINSYNEEDVFIILAPHDMLDECPFASECIARATQFAAGCVYVADSFDDVSGQIDLRVHLFAWDVRIPLYRARTHLSSRFGYVLYACLGGEKVGSDEFFRRPVGICPDRIYGAEQADLFADEWGWRCGMIYNIDVPPRRPLWHKIEWSGATTFDHLRTQIENAVGRCRMLWIYFPRDQNGVLFYQASNPLCLADGLA
jgi:hypothetical protein